MTAAQAAVWQERWQVQSTTDSSKTYTVARKKDGTMGCACPAWKFHKAPKPHCKHIISLLAAIGQIASRSRIFLDAIYDADKAINTFPSQQEVDRVVGRSSFDMQVTVRGEQFKVSRVFLEE